ncbi:MAG TPA: YggS family pyridoxal phosphate-dependent enzyme [Acidiferrobacterales bacterium]|nr:YggS family pyridoxal phosphate-dependent enzyme [Acidiferrobacterales bacterium]
MHSTADIATNLEHLRASIADAARRAGRHPEDVKLVAVSKTQPPEAVAAAFAAGQRVFGENTVQDALTKIPRFAGQGLEWHFIGHLQSNKARFIPGNFSWVHSLASVKLAERLARLVQEQNTTVNALLEVNITRDPAKHGVAPEDIAPLLEQLLKANLSGVHLRGLMAIGPHPATESERRACFAALRKLRDDCAQRFALPGFTELSMGMSGDFIEAILEGSTMVRVGTALFGERNYS